MTDRSSPFPGMDPYLEDPPRWSSVHRRLIVSISDVLAATLAPDFIVDIEQRVYIVSPEERRGIEPDVYVTRERTVVYHIGKGEISPATLIDPLYDPEIGEDYLTIRDSYSREVVTTIEVLSPANKKPGSRGFESFQEKRAEVMASPVHWIEIDLLRAGRRPPEVAHRNDYYALLKRGRRPSPYEVWFFSLRTRMPTIAVPLRPPFEDVPLDLQAVLDDVYVRARYVYSIDYTLPVPPPPLRPEDEAWARERIAEWQKRQAQASAEEVAG